MPLSKKGQEAEYEDIIYDALHARHVYHSMS